MDISYTQGPHIEQPVPDTAPTVDYLSGPPTQHPTVMPATQNFYVHPATSGFIVEMEGGRIIDLST